MGGGADEGADGGEILNAVLSCERRKCKNLGKTIRAFDADLMSESACILDLTDASDVPRWRVGVARVVFRTLRGGKIPSASAMVLIFF